MDIEPRKLKTVKMEQTDVKITYIYIYINIYVYISTINNNIERQALRTIKTACKMRQENVKQY